MEQLRHILIAEDEDELRDMLARVVRRTLPNALITSVADGLEALDHFIRNGGDLIITDNRMPNMTGLELVCAIRAISATTPVIMISSDPVVEHQAIGAGANAFVMKPMSMMQVVQAVLSCV